VERVERMSAKAFRAGIVAAKALAEESGGIFMFGKFKCRTTQVIQEALSPLQSNPVISFHESWTLTARLAFLSSSFLETSPWHSSIYARSCQDTSSSAPR